MNGYSRFTMIQERLEFTRELAGSPQDVKVDEDRSNPDPKFYCLVVVFRLWELKIAEMKVKCSAFVLLLILV